MTTWRLRYIMPTSVLISTVKLVSAVLPVLGLAGLRAVPPVVAGRAEELGPFTPALATVGQRLVGQTLRRQFVVVSYHYASVCMMLRRSICRILLPRRCCCRRRLHGDNLGGGKRRRRRLRPDGDQRPIVAAGGDSGGTLRRVGQG